MTISNLWSDLWLEILSFIPLGERRREWKMRVKEIVNLERVCSGMIGKVNGQLMFYSIANKLMKECASEFWINYYCSFQLVQSIEEDCLVLKDGGNTEKRKYKRRNRDDLMKVFKEFRNDIDWRKVVEIMLKESFVESYLVRLTETMISRIYHCGFFLRNLACGFVTTKRDCDLLKFQESLKNFDKNFVLTFLNGFIESKFNYELLNVELTSHPITEFDYIEITPDERFRRRLLDWWFNIGRGCFKEIRRSMKRRRFGVYRQMKLEGTIQNSNVDPNYPTYHFNVHCIIMMNDEHLIVLVIPSQYHL